MGACMTCGIYKIALIGSNDKFYVGHSINIENRWKQHRLALRKGIHHSVYLQNSWNKYGSESFEFVIIEEVEANRDLLCNAEQKWLDKGCAYNIFPNARSPLGHKMSEEVKAKMRGRVRSPEHCKAISLAKKGFKHTEQSKLNMSIERKARGIKPPSSKGKKQSPEHRAKIAAALMGNKNTLGFKHTPEQIEKMRAAGLARGSKL